MTQTTMAIALSLTLSVCAAAVFGDHASVRSGTKWKQTEVRTLADRYYSTVVKAIRKHDPNHLVIGSRLNGRNINDAVFRGCRSLDVVSMSCYHRWSARHLELERCTKLSGRPVLQSEWYANVDTANAGYLVKTQRDRGLFYVHHALSLLEDPNCIGWHWFKYGTQVDKQFRPHTDMTGLMRSLNENVYGVAAHFKR